MKLAAPAYTETSLEPWMRATGLGLPLPPGDPSTWTCLLREIGPGRVLSRSDRGVEWCDAVLLRAVLEALGRPTTAQEQEALLLATPVASGGLPRALGELLGHPSYWVRERALLAHAALEIAAPGVRDRLGDSDNDVRRAAAEAVGRLADRGALPALLDAEWDGDTSVSAARIEACVRLRGWDLVADRWERIPEGEARDVLGAMLRAERGDDDGSGVVAVVREGDEAFARAAARWLRTQPAVAARHAEALVGAVQAKPELDAHLALARAVGTAGEDAIEVVVELLASEEWTVRAWACVALAWAGEAARSAEGALVERLDDDDGDVQREAALALAAAGARVPQMAQRLARVVTREHGFLERAALRAPAVLGAAAALWNDTEPGPGLITLVANGSDERLRGIAALVLAVSRPHQVGPLLQAMARDDSRDVPLGVRRFAAAGVLLTATPPEMLGVGHRLLLAQAGDVNTGTEGPIERLRGLDGQLATLSVKDGDWPIRIDAMRLLQRLGRRGPEPYRDLLRWQARHDPDSDVRRIARGFFEEDWLPDTPAQSLVELLVPTKGSSDDQTRGRALHRLHHQAPALAAELARELLGSDTRSLARAAAEVVGRSTEGAALLEQVASAVVRLEDANWVVREAACDLLGAVGPDRVDAGLLEEVAEALRVRAAEDYDDDVRKAAAAALVALGVSA